MLASHRTCCQIPDAAQPRLSEWHFELTKFQHCCQPEEGCAATWQKNHTDTSQELLGYWYHPRKKLSYSECKVCLWNSTASTQNLYTEATGHQQSLWKLSCLLFWEPDVVTCAGMHYGASNWESGEVATATAGKAGVLPALATLNDTETQRLPVIGE